MGNIATVQQIYEDFGRGDFSAVLEQLAEDVRWEYHPTGNAAQDHDIPYMRRRNGRETVAGFFKDMMEEDFEMHAFNHHSFLESDNLVAVVIEYDLTVRATGKRVWLRWQDDAYRHFLDTAKAIDAHS